MQIPQRQFFRLSVLTLGLGGFVLLLIGGSLFYSQHVIIQQKKEIAEAYATIASKLEKLEKMQQQMEADNLLFSGNKEAAILEYNRLFAGPGTDTLSQEWLELRKNWMRQQEEEALRFLRVKNQFITQTKDLEAVREEIRSTQFAMVRQGDVYSERLDSLQKTLAARERALQQTQAEMRQLTSQPVVAYREFKSKQGKTMRYYGEIASDSTATGFGVGFSGKSYYRGYWKNNQRHGEGEQLDLYSGQRYIGQFANDTRNGKGRLIDEEGNVFVGYFKDGFRHGEGEIFLPNGKSHLKGVWEKDKYQRNKKANGNGSGTAPANTEENEPQDLMGK
jgi:hypothetical protein